MRTAFALVVLLALAATGCAGHRKQAHARPVMAAIPPNCILGVAVDPKRCATAATGDVVCDGMRCTAIASGDLVCDGVLVKYACVKYVQQSAK